MSGQGTLITAADYNAIQSIAATVLGAPSDASPTYGYNQGLLSSQVSNGTPADKITVTQWSNLQRDLVYARIHQNGSNVITENTLLPSPNSSNAVSESYRSSFYSYAQTVLTNYLVAAPSQTTIVNVGTAARINNWSGNIYSGVSLDFANLANARAHWNSGGNITIACSLIGSFNSQSATKDNTWAGMFAAMGTITINRNTTTISGASTSGYTCTPANIGYFNLTTNNQLIFTCTPPSGAYAANSFKIFASIDGSGRYVNLLIQYNDDSGVTSGSDSRYGGDEYIDGILTQYIGCKRASGSFVTLNPPGINFSGDLTNMSGAPGLYGLSSNTYSVNEGGGFTVTLQTQNVLQGAIFYYTVGGMTAATANARYSASSAYFTVGANGLAYVNFTVNNDLYTDGPSTMTITLNNGLASVSININDTSTTPASSVFLTSNQGFTVPAGVFKIYIAMVGGGGGGGSYAGGGGGGGGVISTTIPVSPGQVIGFTPGSGGGSGANGGVSYFGSFTALGGNAGSSGSGLSGGNGGQSGSGYQGGSGVSTGASSIYRIAGGGGAGYGGGGGNAGQDTNNAYEGTGGTGTTIGGSYASYGVNATYYVGGGGEGGTIGVGNSGGASYGGGPGGGNGQTGFNGTDGTGGGGGGGGAAVGGGTYSGRYSDGTITGQAGGTGGKGGIYIAWPA
jgi:hypothetical protein